MSSHSEARSSVFELVLSPRVRVARIAVVLLMDAVLIAAGIVMIRNWMTRGEAPALARPAAVTPPPPVPTPVAPPTSSARARPPHLTHAPAPPAPPPAPPPLPVVTPLPPIDAGQAAPSIMAPLPGDATPAALPPDPPVDPARVEKVSTGIRYVVELHRDQIEECYRRAAKSTTSSDPLAGRLEIHLRLTATGEAAGVRVQENGTGSAPLGACLVALMGAWRYPSPGEPMDFVWPFTFEGH